MVQGDFGLSLTQDGYLPAAFLVRCLTLCLVLPLPSPGRDTELLEFWGPPCALQTQNAATYAPCSACAGVSATRPPRLTEDFTAQPQLRAWMGSHFESWHSLCKVLLLARCCRSRAWKQ